MIVNSKTIDAKMISKMFLAGAKNLEHKKEWINELNVFPVPDGDTGTNMTLTIMAAAREVLKLEDVTIMSVSRAISSGSLRGARGNSGVILSQIFRGFTKGIRESEEITIPILAVAMEKGVATAYKAVMKPKEGTILTVAKGAATKARELADDGCEDLEFFFAEVIKHADYILSITPEMLPVLKQAGVVDSGGQGLVEIMKGAFDAFLGKELDLTMTEFKPIASVMINNGTEEVDIKFCYCTEFLVLLKRAFNIKKEMDFKEYLETIGDSIVVVTDDDVVKVHVHTNDPGFAIQKALKYGALSDLKIDNLKLEQLEKIEKMKALKAAENEIPMEKKAVGFISVGVGEGICEIFKGLGVDYLIEGGQTMNPSTEDMLTAIDKVNADTIFILPNNKNIILAANQAQSLVKDKEIIVIPTTTVPQGITAVISYVVSLSVEENKASMLEEIKNVKTGQITYAVRDTMIDDKEIKQGDYMGIGDKGILTVGKELEQIAIETVEAMVDDDLELLSIYYGSDIKEEDAEALKAKLEEQFSNFDIELQFGGQPIYYYIISAE